MMPIWSRVPLALLLLSAPALAEEPPAASEEASDDDDWGDDWGDDEEWTEEDDAWGEEPEHTLGTSIFGNAAKRRRIAGSAHEVDEEKLERFEHDDPQKVLAEVPGVYARTEDGFGLRPNIGLRGASSERSSKVTLMEDGVLFAPAPYAAPAAYYFPLMTRMSGVEVFKGPAAIKYGPNTVGGALNLRTRAIPVEALAGGLDLAAGAYMTGKAHAHLGGRTKLPFGLVGGWLLEGVHVRSDGFKRIDRGGETGFDRTDLMLKGRVSSADDAEIYQAVELKLGWGGETSHETYLGLSEEDFRLDPNRRYAATQLGLMNWSHLQGSLSYTLSLPVGVDVRLTAYRNDFERSWRKFNRFGEGGRDPADLLRGDADSIDEVYLAILRGEKDSESAGQALKIGTNARTYYSQGMQGVASWSADIGAFSNTLEVGARVHADRVDRDQTEDAYNMIGGSLVRDDTPAVLNVRNYGAAVAGAAYLHDELEWGDLILVPGVRGELVYTDFTLLGTDILALRDAVGKRVENVQLAVMPGFGASYTLFDKLTVLAGVHKGFSPCRRARTRT
jgi:Fe(3+) dicitrate transport protein